MRLEHSTTQHPDGEEETTINILLDQPGENTRPDDSTDARKTAWCFLRCEDDLDAWSKYTSFLSPFLEEEEDLLCAGGVWHPPSLADQVPPPPCLPLKQGLSLALKQIDSLLSRTSTPGSTPGQVPLSVHLVLLLPRLLPPYSPSEADGESLGTVSETSSGEDGDCLYAKRAANSITKFHPRCKVFLHAERRVDSIKDWGNEVKEAKELPLCSRDGSVLSSLTLSLPDPASLVSLSPHHPLPPMETRLRLSLSSSPLILHLPLREAQTVSFRRKRNFSLYGRKAPTGAEGVQWALYPSKSRLRLTRSFLAKWKQSVEDGSISGLGDSKLLPPGGSDLLSLLRDAMDKSGEDKSNLKDTMKKLLFFYATRKLSHEAYLILYDLSHHVHL